MFASYTLVATLPACAPRPRMCAAQAECGAQASCVAGRCQPEGRTAKIDLPGVRRLVVTPVDVAYVRRGDGAASTPPLFTLGRAADGDALLLLRFSVPLPPTATLLEAYLLLDRSDAVDPDPAPIALHAARIAERWDGRSLAWARLPHLEEVRSPSTVVTEGRAQVRIDVRELVRHWRLHAPDDQGIAVMAENTSPTGMTFALAPPPFDPSRDAELGRLGTSGVRTPPPAFFSSAAEESPQAIPTAPRGPRLELYVK